MSEPPAAGWRLARAAWADLSGQGARRRGGRWNSPGHPVVYLAAEASLPVLEVLVHLDLSPDLLPEDYVLMRVDLSPLQAAAPGAWLEDGPESAEDAAACRAFGDAWIEESRTPVLRVPSVLVTEAANLVVNVRHPLAASLPVPSARPFTFDPRLFR
ncbi:MAG: RES domain-containing protein [Alphaproteobacteria bacterium]|nr:RES domain-containing protein [Alphaproteobacteria bacterium]